VSWGDFELICDRFVATLLHPVFVTSNAARNIQIDFNPDTGEPQVVRSKVIKEYLFVSPAKGDVVPGQPNKQVCYLPLARSYADFSFRSTSTARCATCLARSSRWVLSWTPWRSWLLPRRIRTRTGLGRAATTRSCR